MIKMKIGKKLLLTYFILLITVFVATGITFRVLLQRYLISEAKILLRTEAQAIASTLEKIPLLDREIGPNVIAKREMRIAGRFIDSKVIILNKDRKVLYTNLAGMDKKELQTLVVDDKLKSKEYVEERVPIFSKSGDVKGYVFLFTKVQDLNQISRLMNRTQIMSLIVGGVFAVILGLIFQESLTKPIRKLKHHMTNFSLKDSQPELKISTGDEIEELAEDFLKMVQKLKNYDIQQKLFLQNTSHELKTPLMSIQGYAEAIKDGIVERNEMEESLDVIIDESKRLKKIVDEMIYLIKLDSVEETFHFEKTSIQEIIDQGIKSVKALGDAKGVGFIVEGDCLYNGCFDREKLTRAIINVFSNGIRYAEKAITINCKTHDDCLEILITDDGMGFQNGEESKVFERFYKGEGGGTGIGLAITQAIVAGHKGQIEAYNSIPKGAVFKIVLPRVVEK
jgi:signal transduction histidine kinase